ncbi:MAG: MGH1-like glycoside hydrolase domain-containing protein [Vicinamibacterales bacterium]
MHDSESQRLRDERERGIPWKKWGPYLSDRQWGTVREDYSGSGDAWQYFPHDQARSRAYRWGEDGLAGFSDDKQRLCFALSLWNGQDPILKERLFGLTNAEGNHGEDVKEYYFYLDATPTNSYLKFLYKYPQRAYPYADLVRENRARGKYDLEYELLDTGVFDDDRYFDVFVEYAKGAPEDILIRITVCNRGPEPATLHVLPTLWFRNTWSSAPPATMPSLRMGVSSSGSVVLATHPDLGVRYLILGEVPLLFTDNETNAARCPGASDVHKYAKDGINDFVVNWRKDAVNPAMTGTKAAAHYQFSVPGGGSQVVRLRLTDQPPGRGDSRRLDPIGIDRFDAIMALRCQEADDFYQGVIPASVDDDMRRVMRQSLAGMLWTKQYYFFDVERWLAEHHADPAGRAPGWRQRDAKWFHMLSDDVISMPDKWEYPWFAAWDLAIQAVPLALVDIDFAKRQLELPLQEQYQHPDGQIPACEWNFGDAHPPAHAWAALYIYNLEKEARGHGDVAFLEHCFQKLMMNFTWWANRKDGSGRNVFEGGFIGLDHIGIFDRSVLLPGGGHLEQADGTAWMAFFCQNMLDIALELAVRNPAHDRLAYKFLEHFFWIASAMDRVGEHADELWDEEDGFFYDVLRMPDGSSTRVKVRSAVGLLPLCATTVIDRETRERFPELANRTRRFLERHPDLTRRIAPFTPGYKGRTLFAILNETKLRRVLARMLDENEFLSPYGIRSLSRYHRDRPYVFFVGNQEFRVDYQPAESRSELFGGNANWRGPIWMPLNALILRALLQFYMYYGNDFTVECPTGSGNQMTLCEVASDIGRRLTTMFARNAEGRRPIYGGAEKFQTDPHWRDYLLFHEYFHGDNGAGLGASHQTGWTGLVARLIQLQGLLTASDVLERGRGANAVTGAEWAERQAIPGAA